MYRTNDSTLGPQLIPDEIYDVIEIKEVSTRIITDHDNYLKYTDLIIRSMEWLKRGYTTETLPEVIPDYITFEEVNKRFTKRIDIPFAFIRCSDNQINKFCLLSDKEVFDLGADIHSPRNGLCYVSDKSGKYEGRPTFTLTVYMIDDYFDYNQIRREKKLNKLGI